MTFITIKDLSNTIRENLYKIPHDIDVVVCIPRSGTLAGTIISEFLNKPMTDLTTFINGNFSGEGGGRFKKFGKHTGNSRPKILIVDDTVWAGGSKVEAKSKLKELSKDFDFLYLVVYLEGPAANSVDIYLENVQKYTNGFTYPVIYEWNIFHHYATEGFLCDMDGILCKEPPDERNTSEYETYIQNAIPLITPTAPIGGIVTYRLEKYRNITKEWLSKNQIEYRNLYMFNANSWSERHDIGISPEEYKSSIYRNSHARLFLESNKYQAEEIFKKTGKPVYCYENNIMYGNEYRSM